MPLGLSLSFGGSTQSSSQAVQGNRAPSFTNSKSLSFDGTNDFAKWASNTTIPGLMGAGDWTWSWWVKSSDFSQAGSGFYSTLLYALNFYGAGVSTFVLGAIGENSHSTSAGKLTCLSTRGTGSGSTFFSWTSDSSVIGSLTDDDWNHIVITCDTGSTRVIKAYINGSEVAGTNTTTNQSGTDFSSIDMGNFALGSQTFNAGGDSFDALELDEISLYNSVLSSSNVTDVYNSGVPADETERSGLIGYWRLEDNGTDSSSNSNTLTIDGASFTTDVPS